jgi:hypothetical protein
MNILEGLKFELEIRRGNNDEISKLPEIILHIEELEAKNVELEKKLAEVGRQLERANILLLNGIDSDYNLKKKLKVAVELIREVCGDCDLYTYYEMLPRFREALKKISEGVEVGISATCGHCGRKQLNVKKEEECDSCGSTF